MAIADLVLRYLQALMWPLIVLIIAVMFRRSIKAAVGRLTEVTGPGLSAKFETEAEALAGQAKDVADRQPPAPVPSWLDEPPSPWSMPPYAPPPYGPQSPYDSAAPYGPAAPDGPVPPYDPVPPSGPLGDEAPAPRPRPTEDPAEREAADEDEDVPSEPLWAGDENDDPVTGPMPLPGSQPSYDPGDGQLGYAPQPYPPLPGGGPSPGETPRPPAPEEVRPRVRTRFAAARTTTDSDPAMAVEIAWSHVERAVEGLTYTRRPAHSTGATLPLGVTPEVRGLVRQLDRMRDDAAAHPETVTAAAARAYVTAAEEAVLALYRATGRTP